MYADPQFWDNLAERYSRKPIANLSAYEAKLAITKQLLRNDDRVLDVGCGTGSLAIELAPLVSHVHAVDVSGGMLRIGRQKAEANALENITFHQASAERLPSFEPGSLGAVCAYNIFHLVQARQALLRELLSVLRPGGVLVASTPCLGESAVPFGLILPVLRWLKRAPPVEILAIDALLGEVRAAGFSELTTPDVGAKKSTLFLVARKPAGPALSAPNPTTDITR